MTEGTRDTTESWGGLIGDGGLKVFPFFGTSMCVGNKDDGSTVGIEGVGS